MRGETQGVEKFSVAWLSSSLAASRRVNLSFFFQVLVGRERGGRKILFLPHQISPEVFDAMKTKRVSTSLRWE